MTEQNADRRKSPRWMKALLVGSLALNVAVIGVIAGFMMKDHARMAGSERQIYWIMQFVPESRHDDAQKIFKSRRDDIRGLMRDQNRNLDQVVSAIRAEPYSPETLQAAMSDRRDGSDKRRVIVEEGLLELLEIFNQDERAYFAMKLEERAKAMRRQR